VRCNIDSTTAGTDCCFASVRDSYEPKREELGKKISDILKKDFKINFNPNEIYAYADDGWAKNSFGQMLARCVQDPPIATPILN